MEEAYKRLPKSEHIHWDKFKKVHSEKTVNYIQYILGEKVDEKEFLEVYKRIGKIAGKGAGSRGRRIYAFLKKYNWIK
jgi:cell division protein FtsI/penicillin-binding protein 2